MLFRSTKKCPVTKVAPNVFNITLVQGLNRQIRRMCEHFGYEVVKLERTRIMNVSLKGLPVGDWRDLTPKELSVLLKAVEDSSSQDNHSNKKPRNAPRKKPRADASSKSKPSTKSAGIAKGRNKYAKDDARKPAGSKGRDGRPTGRGKPSGSNGKSGGNGKPATNGKRPAKGRGSKR